jgi:16S rRNA (cytosine967-C5)-methyltransferase
VSRDTQQKNKHGDAPPRPPASARGTACRKLSEQARRWPDFGLAPVQVDGLSDRDASLAHAIYDAAMRRWITLEWIINRFMEKPLNLLEPAVQGILLGGAAQLLFMDRVPAHAAVHEAVELAKENVRAGAGGLVNAVLRKVAGVVGERCTEPFLDPALELPREKLPLQDGGWVEFKELQLPEDDLARLGIATSHPAWLVKRWAARRARPVVRALALHTLISPPTVLNTRYATSPAPSGLIPHEQPGCHCFTGSHKELTTLLHDRPDVWVQDSASCLAVEGAKALFEIRDGLIIDACAGQGTKTRHLAAAFPEATIIATDTDDRRVTRLTKQFQGHPRVQVVKPEDLLFRFNGRADLVLLDVPCTNTGVLARRIEAKYRCNDDQLQRLTALQKQIIADAIALLRSRPRGRILYSTCSLEPEENQSQADWAARWHALKVLKAEAHLPRGLPGVEPSGYSDGAFWAILG